MAKEIELPTLNNEENFNGENDKLTRQKKGAKRKDVEELSEEDRQKKAEIDQLVETIMFDEERAPTALKTLAHELQTATTSLTSVPKPLKLISSHFDNLVRFYDTLQKSRFQAEFSDVLSVLAVVFSKKDRRSILRYRLEGTNESIAKYGDDYMRNLSGEIIAEYNECIVDEKPVDHLIKLADEIVAYYMEHNAECDAVDLLCEIDRIEYIPDIVDAASADRVVLYTLRMSNYAVSHEEQLKMLRVAFKILMKKKDYPYALRVAIKCNDSTMIAQAIDSCEDKTMKKQLAFICSRQRVDYEFTDEELLSIASGEMLSNFFHQLAKELNVLKPKLPEHVYKTHLEETRFLEPVDSARQNLASTIVNAFVNAGFCSDELMTVGDSFWLSKNKDHGMLVAAASLGVLSLWNVEEGLTLIDKYQYNEDGNIKAGAFMAFGLLCSNVSFECDPAHALLNDKVESNLLLEKRGSIMGLGFAYAGTKRSDILEVLVPVIIDPSSNTESSALAALNLGLVFVASCNQYAVEAVLQAIIERQTLPGALESTLAYMYAVGLGLLFLGNGEACKPVLQALEPIDTPFARYAITTIDGMAVAGTGDVLKVQSMLRSCVNKHESDESEFDNLKHIDQAVAVLNIPLIAMSEEIGSEMCIRILEHLLQYADINQRRAVPLAFALQSPSHPKPFVVDTLSKLSHDLDKDVVCHAIFSLGIVGAGTNNSRISGILRQLASFHAKEPATMFVIRVAQGLLHMGKGLLSINPSHSDRFLINPVALGSLLVVLHTCLRMKTTISASYADLLYYLVPAMYPRMLVTVDEDLQPLPVSVRVGQAVDVVGQAGHPKSITGFQTHTTPVLLTFLDRAELATEDYIPLSSVLEGVVILKKNPAFVANVK